MGVSQAMRTRYLYARISCVPWKEAGGTHVEPKGIHDGWWLRGLLRRVSSRLWIAQSGVSPSPPVCVRQGTT